MSPHAARKTFAHEGEQNRLAFDGKLHQRGKEKRELLSRLACHSAPRQIMLWLMEQQISAQVKSFKVAFFSTWSLVLIWKCFRNMINVC
jgi:hypothetical protein